MITVKIKFRNSKSTCSSEGTLFYQITHRQTTRQINTGYKLLINEWDAARARIIISPETEPRRRIYLYSLEDALRQDLERLNKIVSSLSRMGNAYKTEEIVKRYQQPTCQL